MAEKLLETETKEQKNFHLKKPKIVGTKPQNPRATLKTQGVAALLQSIHAVTQRVAVTF